MVNKARGTKDVTLRMKPEFHTELVEFLEKLNDKITLGKISLNEYALFSLGEQMKRDMEKHGIKK